MKPISNDELREYLRKYNFSNLCERHPKIQSLINYVDNTKFKSRPNHMNQGVVSRVSFKDVINGKISTLVKVEKRFFADGSRPGLSVHLSSPETGATVIQVTDRGLLFVGYIANSSPKNWSPCLIRDRDFFDINNATDLELDMMRLSNNESVRCISKRRDVDSIVMSKLDFESMKCMSFIEDGRVVHGKFCFESEEFIRDEKFNNLIK